MKGRTAMYWWTALASTGAAVALTIVAAVAKAPLPGDLSLARRVQGSATIDALAPAVNALGDWRWLPFLAAAAVTLSSASRRRAPTVSRVLAILLPFAVIAILWLGSAWLKQAVQSPRPSPTDGLDIDRIRQDYGFPSGHVYGDAITYGYIGIVVAGLFPPWLAWPIRGICAAIVLLAGLARVSVGAHWPSDTAGGYLWGGAVLAVVLGTRELLVRRGEGQSRAS